MNIVMLLLLILLLRWRTAVCVSSPTLEDNKVPTDEEVIVDLINTYRGQPEQEIALNLPSDEEAFNEIKPILQSGNSLYMGGGGHIFGFPEIDARGFHESLFDDFDDFYPISQRGKRYDTVPISARGFYGDVFTDGFGSFHPVKRYVRNDIDLEPSFSLARKKRSPVRSHISTSKIHHIASRPVTTCSTPKCSKPKRKRKADAWKLFDDDHWASSSSYPRNITSVPLSEKSHRGKRNVNTHLRPLSRYLNKRRPEVDSTGFHGDVFGNFGDFDPLRKRVSEIGKAGFHGDVFHNQFGKFDSLKRAASGIRADDVLYRIIGAASLGRLPNSVNGNTYYADNRNGESLKRHPHENGFEDGAFDYGKFNTVKREPKTSSLLNGDAFHSTFGNFDTMKRTLAGDAFHSQFGRFETMKRNPAKAHLNGFHSDVFTGGFGDFDTSKRTPKNRYVSTLYDGRDDIFGGKSHNLAKNYHPNIGADGARIIDGIVYSSNELKKVDFGTAEG